MNDHPSYDKRSNLDKPTAAQAIRDTIQPVERCVKCGKPLRFNEPHTCCIPQEVRALDYSI
jgi:hypothetical protein